MPAVKITVNNDEPTYHDIDSSGDWACYFDWLSENEGDKIVFEIISHEEYLKQVEDEELEMVS